MTRALSIRRISVAIGFVLHSVSRLASFFLRSYQKSKIRSLGDNVYIGRNAKFTYDNTYIGSNVYIGDGCIFQSTHGKIIIGNNVMFGPHVHIHGGNHKFDVIGVPMYALKKSDTDVDPNITIRDDVWIGACSIILNGATIGRGAVVGAGSVVTRDVPDFAIVAGNPASIKKYRFSAEEIARLLNEGRSADVVTQ